MRGSDKNLFHPSQWRKSLCGICPAGCWVEVALSDGKLLIRDGRQMICVDLENPK